MNFLSSLLKKTKTSPLTVLPQRAFYFYLIYLGIPFLFYVFLSFSFLCYIIFYRNAIPIIIMEEDNFYHILNRGVEKKEIFHDLNDYNHFTDNLFSLNNKNIALPYEYRKSKRLNHKNYRNGIPIINVVSVVCWCLMPNHFHVFVKEKINEGVGLFSKKLTSSHTHYFNLKNDRSGVLFQGRTKILPVERDEHFLWLPFYIMANPLKLIEPQWKEKGINDPKKALEFLENYKYSSFPNLIGKNNFFEITNRNLFYEIYDTNEKKFKKEFIEWLNLL